MKRRDKLPELLAPAGDMEALYAAVAGGADAVYIGAKQFGARAYAKNFEIEEIASALSYCHLHGVRLYVTLNTLLSTKEVEEATALAAELYRVGVDALIVCDLGLIRRIRESKNPIELHASTQMSVHNSIGADEAYALGCTRVVLARELSLGDIVKTTEKCIPETEVFLHGALCVCHSGQCLFSSLVGGRSGNRGECAQPCRLPYREGYALSLSDLALHAHVPELINSGVASLKIEGRMKSPDYVYTVTSVYRRLLDEGRAANAEETERLRRAFSRSGFTDGYLTGRLGAMTGIRTDADKAMSESASGGTYLPKRIGIKAKIEVRLGEPARLSLSLPDGSRTSEVTGESAEPARSAPLTAADLAKRLSKMGATHFTLDEGDVEISLDEGVNLSPSAINSLRRAAAAELADFSREPIVALASEPLTRPNFPVKTSALFLKPELYFELRGGKSLDKFDIVFLPLSAFSDIEPDGRLGVYIPPVITEAELASAERELSALRARGVSVALVGGLGAIGLCRRLGFSLFGDFRLNAMNSYSLAALTELGLENAVMSAEMGEAAVARVGGGAIVYGRIPLMLTERCFIKENFGCKSCGDAALTDRRGEKFPIIREMGHRNIILNSRPTYMGDRMKEPELRALSARHFIFSVEEPCEALSVIRSFFSGAALPGTRRMGKR